MITTDTNASDVPQEGPHRPPQWGNFVGYADEDLLSFAVLLQARLLRPAYYHATQAIEKYFKALYLSDVTSDGSPVTDDLLKRLRSHDLVELAELCQEKFPFYGTNEATLILRRFSEFDQLARYPWVKSNLDNYFSTEDTNSVYELVKHLRCDLPIEIDHYFLGLCVRGRFHKPPVPLDEIPKRLYAEAVNALRRTFPLVDELVRW